MLSFSLFGIPIRIQVWFWLSLGLIGAVITQPADKFGLLALLLFVIAGFISILVHELGHALAGKSFGAPTMITLQAFGGFASFPPNAFRRGQDVIVTAAGPAVQLALGVLLLVTLGFDGMPTRAANLFIGYLIGVSIFWAIINLVPVFPLDGGRLVAAFLGPARRELALKISIGTAIVVGIGAFLWLGSLLFPIFLGMMAHQNWEELKACRGR